MNTSCKNTKGLTYGQHVLLAINLRLAWHVLSDIYQDISICYPQKVTQVLPDPRLEINRLSHALDEQVFFENQGGELSLNAKAIYQSGLGCKIYGYQKLCFRSTSYVFGPRPNQKPRFTHLEYVGTRKALKRVERFFTSLQPRLAEKYPNTPKILQRVKAIEQRIQDLERKLEKELRKEHQNNDELFFAPIINNFQCPTIACVTPSKHLIKRFVLALKSATPKLYIEVDDEFRHSDCNSTHDANHK